VLRAGVIAGIAFTIALVVASFLLPIIYPKPDLKYTANFLHMMFSLPYQDYDLKPEAAKALDLIFLLHADHEQNCSTATVRMVASSRANLFASAAAGVVGTGGFTPV